MVSFQLGAHYGHAHAQLQASSRSGIWLQYSQKTIPVALQCS